MADRMETDSEYYSDSSSSADMTADDGWPFNRYYVVWHCPDSPQTRGIWWGRWPGVWRELVKQFRRGKVAGSGVQLRRYDTLREAVHAWPRQGPWKYQGRGKPPVNHVWA